MGCESGLPEHAWQHVDWRRDLQAQPLVTSVTPWKCMAQPTHIPLEGHDQEQAETQRTTLVQQVKPNATQQVPQPMAAEYACSTESGICSTTATQAVLFCPHWRWHLEKVDALHLPSGRRLFCQDKNNARPNLEPTSGWVQPA